MICIIGIHKQNSIVNKTKTECKVMHIRNQRPLAVGVSDKLTKMKSEIITKEVFTNEKK